MVIQNLSPYSLNFHKITLPAEHPNLTLYLFLKNGKELKKQYYLG